MTPYHPTSSTFHCYPPPHPPPLPPPKNFDHTPRYVANLTDVISRKLVARFMTLHTRELMSFHPDIIIVMQIFTRQNSTREFQRLIKMEASGRNAVCFVVVPEKSAGKVRHKSTLLYSFILIDHISDLIF